MGTGTIQALGEYPALLEEVDPAKAAVEAAVKAQLERSFSETRGRGR